MTTLNKPVRRVTRGAYKVLFQSARPIVASLEPGDIITFREQGRRGRFALPIDTAFRIAVGRAASAAKAAKKLARKGGIK